MIIHILSILLSVGAMFFVGIRLYLMDRRNEHYKVIIYCCFLVLILAYCEYEFLRINNEEEIQRLSDLYVLFLFNISLTPMLAWFYGDMDKSPKYKKWTKPIFYGNVFIALIFYLIQVCTPYKFCRFIEATPYGYGFSYTFNAVFFAWILWAAFINILSALVFYRIYITPTVGREKYWQRLNVIINAVVISTCYIVNAALPIALSYTIPAFIVPIVTINLVSFSWSFSDFKLFEISSDSAIQNIVETMSNMMILTDKKLKIKEVNSRAIELLHLNEENLNDKKLYQAINLNELEIYEVINALKNNPEQRISKEISIRIDDKKVNHILVTASAIINEKGKSTGYVFIGTDLTAYKQTQLELIKSNEELKTSNKELEQFAYVASHDLQEPLRMVGNFVELLEIEYKDQIDKTGKSYIQFAVDGVSRMSTLINDLLNFSRLGKQQIQKEWLNMSFFIGNIEMDFQQLIKEKKAILNFEDFPDKIYADRNLLSMTLSNLISNGIKFCKKERPIITIKIKYDKKFWIFSVQDNGIGIDPKNKEKIFEIFQRLHRKEIYKGTGIGLSICRKAVNLQGGEIWFESELDKGTTFFFSLPTS